MPYPRYSQAIRVEGSSHFVTTALTSHYRRGRLSAVEQTHARTKATFRVAMEAWPRVHEVEESTRERHKTCARLYLCPAFGDEVLGTMLHLVALARPAELADRLEACQAPNPLEPIHCPLPIRD